MILELNVTIHSHRVVYSLLDDLKALLTNALGTVSQIDVLGTAQVLQCIPLSRGSKTSAIVPGCRVTDGMLQANALYRVLREGQVVVEDLKIESMKHFKEKVSKVNKGEECGIQLEAFDQFQVGDVLEAVEIQEIQRTL